MQYHSMTSLPRLLVIAVALLGIRTAAFGQGASGEVPDPLGLRATGELFDRYLELEDSDWLLIEGIIPVLEARSSRPTLRKSAIGPFRSVSKSAR